MPKQAMNGIRRSLCASTIDGVFSLKRLKYIQKSQTDKRGISEILLACMGMFRITEVFR
jgi:hypothetical protein